MIVYDTLNMGIVEQKLLTDRKIRYFALDLLWFLFSKNRFKTQPFWFKFFDKNLYYQDGSWNDPLPMFAGAIMGFNKYLNPSFRKSKFINT